jgi:2-(1,2-epoxy-1,2-dihydrophenyl)acetyl-CoA isomerase
VARVEILQSQQSETGVLTLTMNRPERKNALDMAMADALVASLDAADCDAQVRSVVLTGSGDAFCSGGDLGGGGSEGAKPPHARALMRRMSRPATALHQFSKPVIAKVNGIAAGAGWNLALGCDVIVASDAARFCQIFARRGLSMDLGGTWLLPRLVGLHRAKELALLADWISAEEAERIGVVNRVVPAAELDAFVTDWAEQLAAGPPVALALTKQMLDGASTRSFEEALDLECTSQAVNLATEDTREAFKAFFENRTPTFEGR